MLESARGWAATILFNKELKAQFDAFYWCPDAFSLALLGVWVAHGEGRCFWPDDAVKEEAMRQNCVALKYVDDDGKVTMEYPMNPNSSEGAVVGLASRVFCDPLHHLKFVYLLMYCVVYYNKLVKIGIATQNGVCIISVSYSPSLCFLS